MQVFSKILEICHLPDNWAWLENAKKNHSTVGKPELVRLCVATPHYLTQFIESSLNIVDLCDSRVHQSFLTSLLFLVLEEFQEVPRDVLPHIFSAVIRYILLPDWLITSHLT